MAFIVIASCLIMLGVVIGLWIKHGPNLVTDYEDGDLWEEQKFIPEFTMRSAHYVNRYNDTIYFVQISPNEIQMTGGQWVRLSWDINTDYSERKFVMVDPSGGPCIFQGDNMGRFHDGWEGYMVDYITDTTPDVYIIVCKILEQNDRTS